MTALTDIYNYLHLTDQVATAGQPTDEQLHAITQEGYEVIINLLPGEHLQVGEQEFFEAAGVDFIHIPVLWNEPTLAEFEQFVEAMQTHRERRIFIHCAANMRASAFCYLYRTLCLGICPETALADMSRIWTPNPIWQRFIASVERHYTPE
jgi:protein tyrosine phosphatase (PTP) superfamily phosphohydrolase (DUF442 family)